MAGKHSRNFFDFKKSEHVTAPSEKKEGAKTLSLPFKIIISALVFSLLMSSIFITSFFVSGVKNKKLLDSARILFASEGSHKAITTLAQKNPDVKAWIKIDGTEIDGVVCQGDDDEFYLNHNQLGKKSRFGALFLSRNDTLERLGYDKNIVIFGNNMKDGSMFGSLKNYRKLSFYKQNPFINLYYNDVSEIYTVFAVMLYSDKDDSDYTPTQSSFENPSSFDAWYSETCERSMITTTVNVSYGDEFLTLVTSANDFDGARLVVIAKKTDALSVANTDVGDSKVNENIKYPAQWYAERKTK